MSTENVDEMIDEVMEQLLAGDHPYLPILREQYRSAHMSVEETGVGYVVEFEIPNDVERIPETADFNFGNVEARMDGLDYGLGFVLFVQDGFITELEGFTYEESLPDKVCNLNVIETGEQELEKMLPE